MDYDPFDFVTKVAPTPVHTLSTKTLEIPEEDRSLFEELRSDPKMTNIRDEIALNKYLRILLQREFDQQSLGGRAKLAKNIVGMVRNVYGENPKNEAELYDLLDAELPASRMSIKLAQTMSKLLETSGKLAEQQQKILEGTVITVKGDSRERMREIFSRVILPCCPPEVWGAITQKATEFLPRVGTAEVVSIQ